MKMLKILLITSCFVLFLAPLGARADEWDKKTTLTFDKPVEIPGRVLPAGQYVFKLADSQSDRHIVQVFDRDEMRLYATVLAIPEYRMDTPNKTIVDFDEQAKGTPERVKDWFYPGDNTGEEFLYSKTPPVQLATAAAPTAPVATVPAEVNPPENVPAPAPARAFAPPAPTPPPMMMARAAAPTPPPAAAQTHPAPAPAKHLPKTASSLPLLALLGMGCLGGAGALRLSRRRA